jgi:hypothetical protein
MRHSDHGTVTPRGILIMELSHHAAFARRIGKYALLCASTFPLVLACSLPIGPEASGLTIVIEGSAARTLVPAAGTFIVHGSGTAKVNGGSVSKLKVTVLPIAGSGSLNVTVYWPAALVVAPSIQAQLVPATGNTPLKGSSSYSGSGSMNGYYNLVTQLYDGTSPVAGASSTQSPSR